MLLSTTHINNMERAADPSVFEHTSQNRSLSEDDLLGEHVYPDVLYTDSLDIIDVTTGETPDELDYSIEQAKKFASRTSPPDGPPRVAKRGTNPIESRDPFTSCAFFHFSLTNGMEWHTVFRQAWESDAYDVRPETDYQTGELTITVKKR